MGNNNNETDKLYIQGLLLVIIGPILWAINGNVGSYLIKYKGITPEHITMLRLLLSGIILIIVEFYKKRQEIFYIFKDKTDVLRLLYLSFLGLMTMQYSYFVAVKYSNAATTTIIQSMGPFFIVIITSIRAKKPPTKNISFALIFALIGEFLLVTHGKLDQLAITPRALVFGLLAAIGLTNYNLSPIQLQKKYDTSLIMGWAMLIAGIGFTICFRPLSIPIEYSPSTILGLSYVVILGTLIPFISYLKGSKIIGPQRSSILTLSEPVMSTIIAVLFFDESFIIIDYIGIAIVIFALFLLNKPEKAKLI